jgi:hypothetical protein
MKRKIFWIRLALINLAIVALLGLTLRTKIIFSIPFLDYRNVLSAHSHFAFSGWAGLGLMTLMLYYLLPQGYAEKKIYQWLLALVQVCSIGMLFSFPFTGYALFSIIFSTSYIFVTYVFAYVFIRDLIKTKTQKTIKLLATSGSLSLVISSIGPWLLSYIMMTKSADSYLYRDSVYTFLHFQYNGFFTLSVLALTVGFLLKHTAHVPEKIHRFSIAIVASIIPSLFLSLLWHNSTVFYIIAGIGVLFLLAAIYYFGQYIFSENPAKFFQSNLAKRFFQLAFLSFGIKMILHLGTIFPRLANEVFGDRPVIIGFLHLVFLGFISFYLLAYFVEERFFSNNGKTISYPLIIFASGIIINELLLGLQGLGILFKTNSYVFNWLLWGASIILFTGASLMAITQSRIKHTQ